MRWEAMPDSAPATTKALSPIVVESRHRGAISDVEDDERSRDRDDKSAVRMMARDKQNGPSRADIGTQ